MTLELFVDRLVVVTLLDVLFTLEYEPHSSKLNFADVLSFSYSIQVVSSLFHRFLDLVFRYLFEFHFQLSFFE